MHCEIFKGVFFGLLLSCAQHRLLKRLQWNDPFRCIGELGHSGATIGTLLLLATVNTDTTLDQVYKERGETSLETPKNIALYLNHICLNIFLCYS